MLQNHPPAPTSALTSTFAVHSDQLRSVARVISLPSRSSATIEITLSTNELRLRESTTDDGFSVAATIRPIRPPDLAENEIISFEIPKQFLSSWGHHYDCELSFELDRDQDTLAWLGSGRSFHMRTPVRFVAPKDHTEEPRYLATVNCRELCDAIGYAAILIDKTQVKPDWRSGEP